LRIADAHYRQASYPEAITAYREFLREFPNDQEVPYARYRVILCQFESRGDSFFSAPLEERDLVNIHEADRNISAFLKDYPQYKERERVLYMQKWVRGMLARHELYVARYYLQKDKLKAAVARTEYALVNYKDTGLEPEALVLLGETYMMQGELDDAQGAFEIVLSKYPDSDFVIAATNFMKYLEKRRLSGPAGEAKSSEAGETRVGQ
jgi:outer membrane protein assembly factor BamD